MKKILIFSHWMELGGAEKALIGLLDAIDKNEYSIDLFLMRHSGELLKYIPKEIFCTSIPFSDTRATLRSWKIR